MSAPVSSSGLAVATTPSGAGASELRRHFRPDRLARCLAIQQEAGWERGSEAALRDLRHEHDVVGPAGETRAVRVVVDAGGQGPTCCVTAPSPTILSVSYFSHLGEMLSGPDSPPRESGGLQALLDGGVEVALLALEVGQLGQDRRFLRIAA
jgi:hypothetical protein